MIKTSILLFIIMIIGLPAMASTAVEGIISGETQREQALKKTQDISTYDLQTLINTNPKFVLLDIRMPQEIRRMGGVIDAPQNINVTRGWLELRITRFVHHKDTPIVVYCGASIRSPFAVETLQNMGFTNVLNYSDGFLGWKREGLPVASP